MDEPLLGVVPEDSTVSHRSQRHVVYAPSGLIPLPETIHDFCLLQRQVALLSLLFGGHRLALSMERLHYRHLVL